MLEEERKGIDRYIKNPVAVVTRKLKSEVLSTSNLRISVSNFCLSTGICVSEKIEIKIILFIDDGSYIDCIHNIIMDIYHSVVITIIVNNDCIW